MADDRECQVTSTTIPPMWQVPGALVGTRYVDGSLVLLVYDDERGVFDRMRAKDAERVVAALEKLADQGYLLNEITRLQKENRILRIQKDQADQKPFHFTKTVYPE